jgi:hypothetical protein
LHDSGQFGHALAGFSRKGGLGAGIWQSGFIEGSGKLARRVNTAGTRHSLYCHQPRHLRAADGVTESGDVYWHGVKLKQWGKRPAMDAKSSSDWARRLPSAARIKTL